jgi:hypothetical protein
LVVDYLSGKSAGWDGYAGTGINETFKQSCPNNPQTLATSLQHMKRILSTYAFVGVFIDKIRFPSMANGLTEVFSCFCEHCMAKAAKIGLDLNEVRSVLALNGGEKQAGLGVDLPPGSKWLEVLVKNQGLLQQFIRFRADSINQVVHQISMEVRGLGKKLSLDVFSPGLTALVGQDLTFLGQTADWVKPMIYRFGNGPSSLRSEIPAMINSFGKFLGLEKAEVMKWVWENVDGLRGIPLEEIDKVAPLSLLKAEAHKAVQLLPETAVYLGLETVSIPGVMTITPQNVAEILEIGDKAGVDGYVLSWDLLHTPIENILPLKALA